MRACGALEHISRPFGVIFLGKFPEFGFARTGQISKRISRNLDSAQVLGEKGTFVSAPTGTLFLLPPVHVPELAVQYVPRTWDA